MNTMKMLLFQRIISVFVIFTIVISTLLVPPTNSKAFAENLDDKNISEQELYDLAVDIRARYESYKLRGYGEQCASPNPIKNNVEYLVTNWDLTKLLIQESQTLCKRWDEYGGYRCDPSRFVCMRERPPPAVYTLYKCLCPFETEDFQDYNSLAVGLGKQKVKKVNDSDGETQCEFENIGYGEKIPFELKDFPLDEVKDTYFISESNMPKPPTNEIICGIYHKELYKNVYTNDTKYTIDTGLYYNGISCPEGLKCLMREFLVDCTKKNFARIDSFWIDMKDRADRRAHWPVCTCIGSDLSLGDTIATEDPIEKKIIEMFADIAKSELGEDCDSTDYDRARYILDSNWYLYPPGALDDFKIIHDRVVSKGGLACVEFKGLVCDSSDTKKCVCGKTPALPGFSPEFPTSVNSKGYCQLDTNSDCHFNITKFQCKDTEHCLVHEWDFVCSEESLEYAWKHLEEKDLGDEAYLARCRCTNATIKKMGAKESSSSIVECAWKVIFTFVFVNFVRVKTL